jgi:hypothetical protein
MGNHLLIFNYSTAKRRRLNKGVNASVDPHMIGGHRVYSAYFGEPGTKDGSGEGYRTPPGPANGVAVGHEPESMYMVTSGKNFNDHCCFDYGNAEADAGDDGDGTMEALYFGNDFGWNREWPGNMTGPFIGADIENGMYYGDDFVDPSTVPTWDNDYVTAMLKGQVCVAWAVLSLSKCPPASARAQSQHGCKYTFESIISYE